MAKQIAKDIKELGGFITRNDLRKYKAIARRPLKTNVKGLQMLSLPAPGSGALVSLALKILAGIHRSHFFIHLNSWQYDSYNIW